jgi:hypothetical protein
MATVNESVTIRDEDLAELEKTIQNLIQGIRDPDAMDRAAVETDEAREEIRQRFGELDLAAELTERDEREWCSTVTPAKSSGLRAARPSQPVMPSTRRLGIISRSSWSRSIERFPQRRGHPRLRWD